jgi:hypothetical protein
MVCKSIQAEKCLANWESGRRKDCVRKPFPRSNAISEVSDGAVG